MRIAAVYPKPTDDLEFYDSDCHLSTLSRTQLHRVPREKLIVESSAVLVE